ncbi:MAG TPA: tetratricopeptide repeat protein [Opitutaceae bacterium]|nr:tetratricopeptide repeat protein [Opitutaceae bacterium]
MSAHLARARLLLAQSRPADAERETLLALAAQPDDTAALALLALSRTDLRKNEEALSAARTAIGLGPDDPYLHYVHAFVLHRLDREDEALAAAQEALRLAPDEADHFSLLASIELARRNWPAALAAAERALALNPEHVNAANLRAMALVRLGRKEEATATVDYALHRAPEDAFSHANQGWNCLHRNDPRRAQDHFREALRLDPTLDYAREGMMEALKARNPVYRGMLAYFLWISGLSERLQWGFIIGIYFGSGFIRNLANDQPQLGWVLWPLLGLFYAFVYLSWTAMPMFNLLLRFNRFGRHILTRDQRIATNWFGAFFLTALGLWIWCLTRNDGLTLLLAVLFTVLSLCIAATFARTGRSRLILGIATGALACIGVSAIALLLAENVAGKQFVNAFLFGFLGFQILANVVRGK